MPVALIAAVAITVIAELLLRRSRAGLELRAVGSDETRAHRLGARVNLTLRPRLRRSARCSRRPPGSCSPARSGSATATRRSARHYTLTSITAVVLGGASIFGGRGSFIGALLGALLLTEIISAIPFLQISLVVEQLDPGDPDPGGGRYLLAGARWSRGPARDQRGMI